MVIYVFESIYRLNYFIMTRAFSFHLLEKYAFYIIVMGAVCVSYVVIVPLIRWLVTLESIHLLSYLVSSLVIVTFILLGMHVRDDLSGVLFNILEITLHCLSVFGVALLVFHLCKHVMYKMKQKKQL